ncbi:MAG: cation transporter [Deltaproteobacteria bacterium]|nr:cation transporter [Deltaproteobacteria bacterium]
MKQAAYKATVLNIAGNAGLFGLKLVAGVSSGSIALISDALNSLSDVAASVATYVCVRISGKEADEGHPFGHGRAEPIAGLIIAVLAGILGFEVIRASINRLLTHEAIDVNAFTLAVPVVTMIAKGAMYAHFKVVGLRTESPALMATATDSVMDVFVALAALIGIAGAYYGWPVLDPIAGLVISLWIIRAGYMIGMENIAYLMGQAPPSEMMQRIKEAALSVDGVKAINTARAHYVGSFIHVEIHIEVDKSLTTLDSHAIGKRVQRGVETIKAIEKAFVHIDPV